MAERGRYTRERGEPDYGDYRPPYERENAYHQRQHYPSPPPSHQEDYSYQRGGSRDPYYHSYRQQPHPHSYDPYPPAHHRPYDDYYDYDYGYREERSPPPPPRRRPRYEAAEDDDPPLRGSRQAEDYHYYHNEPRDSRPASYDRPPPKPKTAPSTSVICLNLPPDTTSESLQSFLVDEMGASVDSAVLIRDKATGESKRYGFAQFPTIEQARSFVEPNFPVVTWRAPGSMYEGMRIKIDYSQSEKVQPTEGRPTEPSRAARSENDFVNDGSRDIGNAPSRFLFLRGLDSLVTESEIAEAFQASIEKRAALESYQPGDGGLCRVLLVKDRQSTASWGLAFVEYADVKAAVEGLKTVMSPKVNPRGFKVGSTTVGVTFAHSESFKHDYASSRWSIKDLETGKDLLYWDNQACLGVKELPAAQKMVEQRSRPANESDPEEDFFASLESELDSSHQQPQKKQASEAAAAKVAIPSVKLTSIALPSKSAAKAASSASDTSGASKTGEKRKQREPELIAAKKNSAAIDHWNRKKNEDDAQPGMVPSAIAEEPAKDPFPHGDPVKFQCLLCSRQFKEVDTLKKHNEQSELHQTNLKKPEAVGKATAAKAKLQPLYRDRAAERRVALNQPDKPVAGQSNFKRLKVDAPPPQVPEPPPVQPNKEGIEENNIGRKMLEAAGWSQGEGLGAGGMANPIEARQYQAGVGLGAAPSTAISDLPSQMIWRGAERGRDKARARYAEGP